MQQMPDRTAQGRLRIRWYASIRKTELSEPSQGSRVLE